MRVATIVGTRPEAIKLAPVVQLLGQQARVIDTRQHFSTGMYGHLSPDIVLDATDRSDTTRGQQLGRLVAALDNILDEHPPDVVLVQGDTTSALAGALAANSRGIPLVHLEAGLRSFDRTMPEEHHRVLIDHLAELCCAPTRLAQRNLIAEHITGQRIELIGNTIVEAVTAALPTDEQQARVLDAFGLKHFDYVLATIHRPENADNPANLTAILRHLTTSTSPVVLPVHPRTRRRINEFGLTHLTGQLQMTPPLPYPTLLSLLRHATAVITDSGGIQEEATILKQPTILVRRSNERPEAEKVFARRFAPTDTEITQTLINWTQNSAAIHARLAAEPTPFGDGAASRRVTDAIRSRFDTAKLRHSSSSAAGR